MADRSREIQKYFYSFFSNPSNTNGIKLPKITICAIMGNISKESSWNPDIIENTTAPDKGFGLCQWTFGRRIALEAYGTSVQHQCEFLWSELSGYNKETTGANAQWSPNPVDSVDGGTGFYCSLEDFLAGNGDIEFLTAAFCYCWERPAYSTNHLFGEKNSRVYYAKKFFEDKDLTNTITIQPKVNEDIKLIEETTGDWFPTFYSYLNETDLDGNLLLQQIIEAKRLYIGIKETNKNKLYVKVTDNYFLCIPFSYPSMDDYYFGGSTGNIRGTGDNVDYVDSERKTHYCKNNQRRNSNGYIETISADRPFVLNNCVGAAWGLYNKTIHENVLEGNYTTYNRYPGDGGTCISNIKEAGRKFEVSKEIFDFYDLKGDFPTVGGLISWGGASNHVGFIACIINATEIEPTANPDLKYIYVIESGYDTPDCTWILKRYSSDNNYKGNRKNSTVHFLGTPINQTNSEVSYKIKIEQIGFNKIKISAPKKLFGYPFPDSIIYDWLVPKEYNKDESNFSGNIFDLKDIKFDSNDLSEDFTVEIKKLRRAYGISLMIIYKNESDNLFSIEEESNNFTTSMPSINIYAKTNPTDPESNLSIQSYIPIGKDKKIFVPILKKDGHLYAYFNTDVERLN